MIVHTIVVLGTIRKKMRIGDTIPKTPRLTQNVTLVRKDAVQIPIVVVWSVAPAIVAGGEMENVLYLNLINTLQRSLHVANDS